MITHLHRLLLAALALTLVAACGGASGGGNSPTNVTYSYSVPADIGDGWQVASLTDEGFDQQLIENMMGRVVSEQYAGIDSVTIVKNSDWFSIVQPSASSIAV